MNTLKKCFKCGHQKDRSEFYAHWKMCDGLLGKCKECTKSDTAANIARKMATDQHFKVKEAARQREKQNSRRLEGKASKRKPETIKAWRKRNPEKARAHGFVARALRNGSLTREVCEACGSANTHAHHADYSKPLEVRWLCPQHHMIQHRKITAP